MKKEYFFLICFIANCLSTNVFSQEQQSLNTEDILKMSFAELMNLQIVSASKIQQSIKDVHATVHVITSEQIRERGYFSLEEALSDLPGFQFRNILGFNSYIFMRGAPSQNNLILLMIDGVQINELNSGGFYAGGQFILSDIEQIEVVYGPASALYGSNAVSGIINLITKKPNENSGHISFLGGNFRTGMLGLNLKKYDAKKDLGYSISGQYKTSEKADLAGAHGDYNWTEDMENFENDYSLSSRLKFKNFKAGIDFMEKRSSMTTNFKSTDNIYLDRNSLWDIVFLNAYAKYTNEQHSKWALNSTAYYRNTTVKPNTIDAIIKSTDSTAGKQIGYYRPNHLFGIENQLNYQPVEQFLMIAGLIGEIENLSDGYSITYSSTMDLPPPVPQLPTILHNQLLSFYLQLQYKIIKGLSFNAGFRNDFSSYYGQVLVPRMGFVYNNGTMTIKALYNKAFRSPKPWDYYYGTGNSGLNPEKMNSLELSFSYQIKECMNIGGSVYLNKINDKLIKETSENIDRWINKDMLNTTGFEIYVDYFAGDFSLYANYTYNNSLDQNNIFIPEISMHMANLGFTYSYKQMLKLNLRANYLGNRKNPEIIVTTGNDKIDHALIFNTCVSYLGVKNFNFQLKLSNLLNKEYYHPSNRFNGRYRQPQRTITISAFYELNWKN